ncbi:Na+/H+ antiporter subunit D [Ornithinimicrobium sediminis]|jgi:multicomponent Na+:H+ antiporter subunit D|uniref:Na+/H+ antiporter subunit D n=1 Tax=Ornithinimicrobium sediminis TaxID=2904603 RepID=UPI001E3FF3B9|nr:Na+/H+ antiporter subunit D [Ornithinimicrobium sediminis]MCE0487031.1 Na+/H+ antiporter subunit D [Ornithinimicrobium sediminis]
MTAFTWLVPMVVVLPLVGAGVTLAAAGRTQVQRAVSLTVLTLVLVTAGVLLYAADREGPQVVAVGGWAPTEGIVLVVDRLAALMVIVSVVVTMGVLLYSIGQGRSSFDREDDGQSPLPVFHPTLLVLIAGVATTFVSGDLFHIYVGFEMLLAASFVLLTLGGTASRVQAGITYVFVSLLSSLVFLAAIALVYAATGTVNLALLATRIQEIPHSTTVVLHLLLLVGFCTKAAVFPMSGWLPDSYPTAPAPVTAVFAGLLTKVGIYALIRTETLLFPGNSLNTLLLWAALATMVVGILGAVVQDDIKRMLSFTLVSHIGFLVFGIALGSQAGLSAAIFYTMHHITIQTTLFLVTGLVERVGGTTAASRLGGLARVSPLLALLFFVPALNLAGIPPFSGFLGKVGLIQAGVDEGTWLAYLLVAGSVVTSLLTLYAIARVWGRAFWGQSEEGLTGAGPLRGGHHVALSTGLVVPTVALVAVGLGLTVVAGPLFEVTSRAALDLLVRTPYLFAVLGPELGVGL